MGWAAVKLVSLSAGHGHTDYGQTPVFPWPNRLIPRPLLHLTFTVKSSVCVGETEGSPVKVVARWG